VSVCVPASVSVSLSRSLLLSLSVSLSRSLSLSLCIPASVLGSVFATTTTTKLCINISQMTGGEIAVELIRQSWVNRPLETSERVQLSFVAQYDQQTPSISILYDGIFPSAEGLSFLYNTPTQKKSRF